jgi:YfiH family protein
VAVSDQSACEFIYPDWPAPDNVRAIATTRYGGVSEGDYSSLNLGDHVADDSALVARNREILVEQAALPGEPRWLAQVHGTTAVQADLIAGLVEADAAWTTSPNVPCVVLTADCLPVLLCDRAGKQVAAVHAGWRGLSAGVLDISVTQFLDAAIPPTEILAWLGPAISSPAYEVDAVVKDAFTARVTGSESCFSAVRPGHWQFDLYAAAREILASLGVTRVFGGDFCTYSEDRFYSFRSKPNCGRQASLVWLTD